MRILILLEAFSLGGAEKQAILFADWLQNVKKQDVEVWSFLPGDGSAKIICDRYNLKTREIGYFRGLAKYLYPKQIWEYSRLFKQFKPDVLLGYTNQADLLLGLVWKYTGAKYFIWGQQGIEAGGYSFNKKSDRLAIDSTPCFISNSVNGAEFLIKEVGVPPEKVKVILNGPEKINPQFTAGEWNQKLGLNAHQFKALMVGHFALRKDHETLVKAWKLVVDDLVPRGIEPILLLAGIFGNNTQQIIDLSIELQVHKYIKFLGNTKDVSGLNRTVDIHILSSNTEGLPNSLLEAMEAKLPVVGSDIAGIREAVGEENYKYLSPPKNFEKMAENILLFANNADLRKEVGERNLKRVLDFFQLDNMCEQTWQIMQDNTQR